MLPHAAHRTAHPLLCSLSQVVSQFIRPQPHLVQHSYTHIPYRTLSRLPQHHHRRLTSSSCFSILIESVHCSFRFLQSPLLPVPIMTDSIYGIAEAIQHTFEAFVLDQMPQYESFDTRNTLAFHPKPTTSRLLYPGSPSPATTVSTPPAVLPRTSTNPITPSGTRLPDLGSCQLGGAIPTHISLLNGGEACRVIVRTGDIRIQHSYVARIVTINHLKALLSDRDRQIALLGSMEEVQQACFLHKSETTELWRQVATTTNILLVEMKVAGQHAPSVAFFDRERLPEPALLPGCATFVLPREWRYLPPDSGKAVLQRLKRKVNKDSEASRLENLMRMQKGEVVVSFSKDDVPHHQVVKVANDLSKQPQAMARLLGDRCLAANVLANKLKGPGPHAMVVEYEGVHKDYVARCIVAKDEEGEQRAFSLLSGGIFGEAAPLILGQSLNNFEERAMVVSTPKDTVGNWITVATSLNCFSIVVATGISSGGIMTVGSLLSFRPPRRSQITVCDLRHLDSASIARFGLKFSKGIGYTPMESVLDASSLLAKFHKRNTLLTDPLSTVSSSYWTPLAHHLITHFSSLLLLEQAEVATIFEQAGLSKFWAWFWTNHKDHVQQQDEKDRQGVPTTLFSARMKRQAIQEAQGSNHRTDAGLSILGPRHRKGR